MSTHNVELDVIRFPLHGNRLIEASAGTGKTYTIAALYLRLVLGHGDGSAASLPPLSPRQILVVTFTKAATEELRGRIRERLQQATEAFRSKAAGNRVEADPALTSLLAEYPAEQCAGAARRLQLAAESMDEAAVFTIHGWAQRMLREHAFDSGSLFTQELDSQDQSLAQEAARDYWRQFAYALPTAHAAAWQDKLASPDALLAAVRPLLNGQWQVRDKGQPVAEQSISELFAPLDKWQQAFTETFTPWQAKWLAEGQAIRQSLFAALNNGVFNGQKVRQNYLEDRLAAVDAWAASGAQPNKGEQDKIEKVAASYLATALKKGAKFEAPEPLRDLDALLELLSTQPDFWPNLRLHAAGWIAARIERDKQRLAQLDFDDLLNRLDRALQGPAGARLASAMAAQFPAALIDEFQDTDPVQYRLFEAIYRERDSTALLLIGDPKQAIYAFRGADIHTYLKARSQAATPHFTLGTNYRSSHAMVQAVNALFEQGEKSTEGAFYFAERGLPFHAVAANGRDEQWQVEGQPQAALTVWLSAEPAPSKGAYEAEMANACASEIVRLLNLAEQQQAGFAKQDELKPLRPGDIAVLVRSGREADVIRQTLRQRGVRSVYLSERDSVFTSNEAHDVLLCLRACTEPHDSRALIAALGCASLGRSWAELDALHHDEQRWEAELARFNELHSLWRKQGVLSTLYRLLRDFNVPERLLSQADSGGERRLTNLLQLAELLQQAAASLDTPAALLRHLAEQIEQGGSTGGDEALVRLESEADLVQVITIHKSKGLEYPLVFLPFIAGLREASGNDGWRYHNADGEAVLELDSSQKDAAEQAERERLQEDLRLLYVALTRARHACWLGLAAFVSGNSKSSKLHKSAIGYLLSHGQPLDAASLKEKLDTLAEQQHTSVATAPEASDTRYQPSASETPTGNARPAPIWPHERWWVASYSALAKARGALTSSEAPDSADEQTLRESSDEALATPAPSGPLASFPAGPGPGTFLHGLLEWLGLGGFNASCEAIREEVGKRCVVRQWQAWIEPLTAWLNTLRQQSLPLAEGRVQLNQLRSFQVEMEFWLGAEQVSSSAIDRLLHRHLHPSEPRPALAAETLNGMLKGFIDLVFEHDGRYYVADYKSNRLPRYDHASLSRTVLDKRYDLQCLLYTLALHRLLKTRLPDYDYQRHMGGALYLFLRGVDEQGAGLYHACPAPELIAELDALFSAETAHV
ncbi:DNA helicase/exodeoxyribonuclease V, beta subunit [Atopomonas hussainii]|uniref:RecBCD enzyme subunit RecB n=1 Tax=Atopomonas hussainii TaxID=1429083 RepID=A0A1H7T3G7_9GAMM|nr:exodeoxyribonuclease V subunit beta [Atopomonas hussainii]SEL78826.1 DNA helicase/exodeoxyribonuclease V, beta subunit [Atopomonas hussainii]